MADPDARLMRALYVGLRGRRQFCLFALLMCCGLEMYIITLIFSLTPSTRPQQRDAHSHSEELHMVCSPAYVFHESLI